MQTFYSKCTFECLLNYEMVGKNSIYCHKHGKWTPSHTPTCKREKMFGIQALFVLSFISAMSACESCTHIENGLLDFGNSDTYTKDGIYRRSVQTVQFASSYGCTPPTVVLSLLNLDMDNTANTRYKVTLGEVTVTSFKVTVETWDATHIWSAKVSWAAFSK
ncbi:uncharacterized protein LOC131940268 [Physella acuta]|uniref:uncharacterized protein LOC131940268 n=1 Tax=Physella acuta TaxID=109671 RepID=UPI0027DB1476|nr:uncharacterized protein LOC131940268 [Physella acuta]XP_059154891.1 uncharacterized protein LOC131940268 [Physella acuta]